MEKQNKTQKEITVNLNKISQLYHKRGSGGKLTFAERNILNMYENRKRKEEKRKKYWDIEPVKTFKK